MTSFATLSDVAKQAGVSTATVSFVLSGARYVSPELQQRVLAAVAELNYRPNRVARSLRSRRTFTVGLIVTNVENPGYTEIAGEIERAARRHGYSVILCNSDDDSAQEASYVELLEERMVDGLIIAPTPGDHGHLLRVRERGIPLVLVNRDVPGLGAQAVLVDAESAAREAVSHLIEHGHRRIGAIAGPASSTAEERLRGYRAALEEAGIPLQPELVRPGHSTYQGGKQAARELMSLPSPPTALVSFGTRMSLGMMVALRESRLRCPRDVAVVAFSDTPWMEVSDPPVTAVAQPFPEIGRVAVTRLIEQIGGTEATPEVPTRLGCRLVIRSSCGCRPDRGTPRKSVAGEDGESQPAMPVRL